MDAAVIDVRLVAEPVRIVPLDPFPPGAGGESVFLGRTLAETHPRHGDLKRLSYEAYEPLARRVLEDLARRAAARFGCLAVRVHHAVGEVPLGNASVLVQVACGHRREAFEACRYLIDRLKTEAPIWKREEWADGSTWSRSGRPTGGLALMTGYLKVCTALYWIGLILWISAHVAAAVAAMSVFPTLDRLALSLEAYPAFPVAEHPRLAAGIIMEGVFFAVDVLQFLAIPLTVITLLAQFMVFRLPLRRPANAIRTACIVLAACAFAWHATMLAPRMNRELRRFWTAAAAGEVTEARDHRAAFNRLHPTADAILRIDLLLLVVAAAASGAALCPAHRAATGEARDAAAAHTALTWIIHEPTRPTGDPTA